jgi:hypothetical protein
MFPKGALLGLARTQVLVHVREVLRYESLTSQHENRYKESSPPHIHVLLVVACEKFRNLDWLVEVSGPQKPWACTFQKAVKHVNIHCTMERLQDLRAHPKKPNAKRIEELTEPWEEGVLYGGAQLQDKLRHGLAFDTSSAFLPPALFNQDPDFERSIFIPGVLLNDSLSPVSRLCYWCYFVRTLMSSCILTLSNMQKVVRRDSPRKSSCGGPQKLLSGRAS